MVCMLKSQLGVRMPTGRMPVISSSLSAARICRSRSSSGASALLSSWIQLWIATSWPSATARRCSCGWSMAMTAGTKKVAGIS